MSEATYNEAEALRYYSIDNLARVPAGPRPTNTLSRVATPSQQHIGSQFRGPSQGILRQLETRTTVGDNLWRGSPELGNHGLSTSERLPKRRKLDLYHNSQDTPHVLDGSDDEDQLMTDGYTSVRHVPTTSKHPMPPEPKPITDRETSNPTVQDGLWTTGVAQYKDVEKRMDSSLPNTKKHRDRQKRKARGYLGTPRSSFASSQSDSIEFLDNENLVEPPVKVAYKGTANLCPSRASQAVRGGYSGRNAGDRSPHFPASSTASQAIDRNTARGNASGVLASTEAPLRNLYRDIAGKRRSGADRSSSDELVTAGSNSRALSPVKTTRSQTPSKNGQNSPGPSSIEDEPIQSNIRPATFTRSVNKQARASSRANQRNEVQGNPSVWSLPLNAYYSQGNVHKADGLKIVYTESDESYDIYHNELNLAKVNPELRIHPKKINRIYWAQGGKKMRFESSKIGKMDNVLDIELHYEKDVQEFTAVLQASRPVFVKGESQATLDKRFEYRLEQQRRANVTRKTSPEKQPADVVLADVRVKRADTKRVLKEQHHDGLKRRRIVDALGGDGRSDSTSRPRHVCSESGRTSNDKPVASNDHSKEINEVNLGPLEQSLRRSSRSHNINGPSVSRTQNMLSHMLDDKIERYSRNNDMGKPWLKPLVYPKEGKKRTTVEWDDLERLDEGEFLNDNLIAFYLRYLECQAEKKDPTISRKVYIFNTFFYERLTSSKPGHKGINYEAVRKWTRGIDLFTYDFVVVPVHESVHWYVAIICNLPALSRKLGGMDEDLDHNLASGSEHGSEHRAEDTILFSSSTNGGVDEVNEHETATSFAEMSLEPKEGVRDRGNSNSYSPDPSKSHGTEQEALDDQFRCSDSDGLRESGGIDNETRNIGKPASPRLKKGRRKSGPPPRKYDPYKPTILTFDSFGTAHFNAVKILKQYLHEEARDKRGLMEFDEKELHGVTAKDIPEQSNFYDCGLFLLGYIEKMLEDPRHFIDKVMRRGYDIKQDWSRLDPSKMRTEIRELLMELHRKRQQEGRVARQSKMNSKTLTQPLPSSPTEGKPRPSNSDSTSETVGLPVTASEGKPQPLIAANIASEPSRIADESSTGKAHDVVFKASMTGTAEEQGAVEANPSQSSHIEPPPQSFLVLDSQSQPPNVQIPALNPKSSKSLTTSPVLPSTIPDSQPQVADIPVEPDVRPKSPVASKKPRRIDNFSSPLSAKKSRSPKKDSDGTTGSKITGTNPKVVISID
ncbi:MAG: hypothetical protein LQ343_004057 [Gyalolechia ehrenbergii]|nr:MAG: hypothetical protein LQ343_004057 [Gyalolechia ehrenbergii]